MPFINTAGLTIIGDGSQWFWSMAAFLAIPVTGYLIYSQMRGQRSANAVAQVESFDRESFSEQMNRNVVELLSALRDHKEPPDLPKAATAMVGAFWENFATLARAGHRDPKLLELIAPTAAQAAWVWLAPWAKWRRAETGRKGILADLEWLASLMAEMDRRAGRAPVLPAQVVAQMTSEITFRQELIREQQAMRTVFVAAPEAVARERPAAAAPPVE